MSEEPKELSAFEIVKGLRSQDVESRQEALASLFPEGGSVLVRVGGQGTNISATDNINANQMFCALLYLAQQFGKPLGLELNWSEPTERPGSIVIPRGI